MKKTTFRALRKFLASRRFFLLIVGIFVAQTSWLAISINYPQAFDEQYHFGATQLHAEQWAPFFAEQPDGADIHGALVRNPSILYHYALSFVYRFIVLFTDNQVVQIILLRFTSIALAVWGLFLFRRLFRVVGISPAKSHLAILFVSLLPVYVLLASQLNYDNLLIPVTTLTIIWSIELYRSYLKRRRLDWFASLRLLIAITLFSTIKFSYLPVAFAVVLLFAVPAWKSRKAAIKDIERGFSKASLQIKSAYVFFALSAAVLFTGGIGYNLATYHSPNPSCEKVLTVERCMSFGPFARDYANKQAGTHADFDRILEFPYGWTETMLIESVFTVYSYYKEDGSIGYYGDTQLPQLLALVWVWFTLCTILILVSIRYLVRAPTTRVLLWFAAVYVGAVLYVNFKLFYKVEYFGAVHARYVFPVIIPIVACTLIGYSYLVAKLPRKLTGAARKAMSTALLITLLLLIQGGGMLSYILFSTDSGFWSSSEMPFVRDANSALRDILQATIPFSDR